MPKSTERIYPEEFMTDAVKYGNEKGDKNASLQFGVSISIIKYWRRRFPKIPAKAPYKTLKSSTEQTKIKQAVTSKSTSIRMDTEDKILADWLIERMEEDHFPSLLQIAKKAGELNLKRTLQSKSGARTMMRRSGLAERWRVGALQRLSLENRKVNNFNFFPSTETKSKKQHIQNKPIKMVKSTANQETLEKLLAKWTTERLDCDRRPTLSQISARYVELAKIHKIKIKKLKSPKSFCYQFLVRAGLRERWRDSFYSTDSRQKFVRNRLKTGYTNPVMTEEILKDETNKLASISGIETTHFQHLIKRNDTTKNSPTMMSGDEIEQQLLDWLKVDFTNDTHPTRKDVMAKVYEIMNELSITNFKPTDSWYRNFMREKFAPIRKDANGCPSTSNENLFNDPIPVSPMETEQTETAVGLQVTSMLEYPVSEDSMLSYDSDDKIYGTSPTDCHADIDDPATFTNPPIKTEPDEPTVTGFSHSHVVEQLDAVNSNCKVTSMQCFNKENSGKSANGGLVVKRKFGSNHPSNLNEQLRFAESASYVPVELPVRPPMFEEYTISDCEFGSTARKKHFFLEQGCVFLNHGAFGGALKEAVDYNYDWQRYLESQPLRFFDRVLFPQIAHIQKRLAKFIGCKASEITFTTNVTTAINAVLQGLPLNEESSIYYLSLTYDAVKKIIKHVCMRTGAKAIEISVTLPLSKPEDIVSLVRSTLKSTTTLAVFDHIPSDYAFIMPIRELVSVCHQRGVQVLIDGAHGLGQLHLDLSVLGADYYMGNCHNWFCSPKGCAFMYVNKQLQRLTRGLIISRGYDDGFHSQFAWTGAKDYCSYLSLHALINFWTTVGPNKIRDYCKSLLKNAVEYFMSKWDAELLAPIEYHGMMCCVSLPSILFSGKEVSYDDAEIIQNRLYSDFNIEVPIKCIENMLYVRISAHIYNEFSEYATLAAAILQIADTAN